MKLVVAIALMVISAAVASGVILYRTDDPVANTTQPKGELAGSGWQYEGSFGDFLGTTIAPHFFITAKHLGKVADKFVFRGTSYSIVRGVADQEGDLRIFEVEGTFPEYAPLYKKADEVGKHLVVIGRGTQRGPEKIVNDQLRGWSYGQTDSVQRWGENKVAGIVGRNLYILFEKAGFAHEAVLSSGDSGGAVFLNDGGTWKLAGINSDVDKFASGPDGGGPFTAALFDERGSYRANGTLVSGGAPVPSGFYAARISVRAGWIDNVIGKAEPKRP